MPLAELQRIKHWHARHRVEHPVEYQLWDAMLTLWVAGWVGWIPASAFHQLWAIPLCLLAVAAPGLYCAWRRKAHREQRVRCDWIR
ncbi:MAG: hypothetical protein NVS3B2_14720 [Ramlibacter sp.]